MSVVTIILVCILLFLVGVEIGDNRATKREEFFFEAMLEDHKEDIKLLVDKIIELKGGEDNARDFV